MILGNKCLHVAIIMDPRVSGLFFSLLKGRDLMIVKCEILTFSLLNASLLQLSSAHTEFSLF